MPKWAPNAHFVIRASSFFNHSSFVISQPRLDHFAQPHHAAADARFHSAERLGEALGDLGLREAAEERELDRFALLAAELADGLPDHLCALDAIDRVERAAGVELLEGGRLLLDVLVQPVPALDAAQAVDGLIARERHGPRERLAARRIVQRRL